MNELILLTALGILAMFGGIFKLKNLIMPLVVLGLLGSLYLNFSQWNLNMHLFHEMLVIDNFSIAFSSVCIIAAIFIILFYHFIYAKEDSFLSEVYALIIFSLAGIFVMVSFNNLLMLFLGIEILSLSLYVLAGIRKKDLLSNEAAMKYFLMGAFSTGFLLFGISLLYGASGSFSIPEIANYIQSTSNQIQPIVVAGILLILISLLFKVAAFPFHFWTPDVYQGSPTIITAYMATAGKVASFAAFLRLIEYTFISTQDSYQNVLWIVAVVTILAGNIIAIYQNNVKRMLAYSSIAHAGYMLIALMAGNSFSNNAILFYAAAYTFASLAAFVIVLIVQQAKGNENHDSFNGLAKENPLLAIMLVVAMLSLAGIPPAAGFFAKFYIFSAAISSGYVWLIVFAVISSFISVYYYFRPVISAYMRKGNNDKINVEMPVTILLLSLSALTIILGLLPGILSGLI